MGALSCKSLAESEQIPIYKEFNKSFKLQYTRVLSFSYLDCVHKDFSLSLCVKIQTAFSRKITHSIMQPNGKLCFSVGLC